MYCNEWTYNNLIRYIKYINIDIEDSKKNRDFAFDYSFWSHD